MPFEIVRNDIVHMQVDAIVNTANPRPVIGSGTDSAVHAGAGPRLLKARQRIGDISVGDAAITRGYDLKANYVIHTVGPVWRGGSDGEPELLRQCYRNSLELARRARCRSVAFPLISTGNYGFPKDLALRIAMGVFSEYLMKHEMTIYLVVFSREAFGLSEKLFQNVTSFIDEHYVEEKTRMEYPPAPSASARLLRDAGRRNFTPPMEGAGMSEPEMASFGEEAFSDASDAAFLPEMDMPMPAPAQARRASASPRPSAAAAPGRKFSLKELLSRTDAGFTDTLLKLIDQTGKKDSEIYARANVTRQHFSKIRKNPQYKPTKATAIAFAIALELDLEQTRDLIGRAGYALTNSSKFDVIIMYFIQEGNYNLFEINAALFEFDQSLLGA